MGWEIASPASQARNDGGRGDRGGGTPPLHKIVAHHGVSIGQDVETAVAVTVEDKIGHEVTRRKTGLKQLTREEAPVAGEGQVRGFEGGEIGGDLRQRQAVSGRGEGLRRLKSSIRAAQRGMQRLDLRLAELGEAQGPRGSVC